MKNPLSFLIFLPLTFLLFTIVVGDNFSNENANNSKRQHCETGWKDTLIPHPAPFLPNCSLWIEYCCNPGANPYPSIKFNILEPKEYEDDCGKDIIYHLYSHYHLTNLIGTLLESCGFHIKLCNDPDSSYFNFISTAICETPYIQLYEDGGKWTIADCKLVPPEPCDDYPFWICIDSNGSYSSNLHWIPTSIHKYHYNRYNGSGGEKDSAWCHCYCK